MTDAPGREPEQRLPARRPPSEAAPVERFSAPPTAHTFELTPERAAGIVRQSASARWVGLIATIVVALFLVFYWFYELGAPLDLSTARLDQQAEFQQVTSIERGYNLYQANCARCHGKQGEGGIGPVLNDDAKLYLHLSPAYLQTVLEVGGRYVCGNASSLMPIWSNQGSPPGPLNYIQIEELIEFIRSDSTRTYNVRDPELNEPIIDPATGKPETFPGWYDKEWRPAPDATPVPACYLGDGGGGGGGGGGTATPPPDAPVLEVVGENIAYDVKELEAPANATFVIHFENKDESIPHDVDIRLADGTVLVDNPLVTTVGDANYVFEGLDAGTYTFICSVHPIPAMTGTLTVK
jgi:mono/diheme cytochrome c family protein/plastocyanin